MKTFKETIKLFKFNLSSIILFEIIYKVISLAILAPFLYTLLNFSVKMAGISFLSVDNMNRYFRQPSTYALVVVALFFISLYILINISGLLYAIDSSKHEEKTNPISLLIKGMANAFRIVHPRNLGVIIYILFILPVTYTVMISGSLVGIKMPEVFKKLVVQNKKLVMIALIVYGILCLISLLGLFSLNYYTIYKIKYNYSLKMSIKVIGKHFFRILFGVMIWNLALTLILFLLEGTLATALASILSKFVTYKKVLFIFKTSIKVFFLLLYLVFSTIATPLIFSYISAEFYKYDSHPAFDEYNKIKARRKQIKNPKLHKIGNKVVSWTVLISCLLLNTVYVYLILENKVNIRVEYSTHASVTAHRGDSKYAPENTMAAIIKAAENQADIIEIDIRQTKDGHYVLMHDENMYRTTGEYKRVGNATLEEIKQLDAGRWFSTQYVGEQIPTLEEVLEFAKEEDIFLNIELKPANTDNNYIEGVLEILEEYDFFDNCVLASTNYELLGKIKNLNPEVKTVYIMAVAFGRIGGMNNVDIFSIRHNFVTKEIVEDIHDNGKEIYSWTVNSESDIKKLLYLDVDGVITDNPYNTKDIIFEANDSLLTDWLTRIIMEY